MIFIYVFSWNFLLKDASMAEIKKAYRRLSLKHHPDKHGGDEVQFMRIAKAYAA